jgi:hypothetical protein
MAQPPRALDDASLDAILRDTGPWKEDVHGPFLKKLQAVKTGYNVKEVNALFCLQQKQLLNDDAAAFLCFSPLFGGSSADTPRQ